MNLLNVVRRQQLLLGTGILLGLLGTVATLAQPALVGVLIAALADGGSVRVPATILALLFVLDALLAASQSYLIGRAGENIVLDLRTTLTGRLLHARMRAFNRLEHGDVLTRTVSDTSIARLTLSSSLAQLISAALTVLGCVVIMAVIDWRLLLVTVGCLGVASTVALVLARAIRKVAVQQRQQTSAFGSGLLRVLSALTTVKGSRAEAREAARLAELAGAARASGIRVAKLGALLMPAMNVGTQVSLAVVIAWGMARTATGALPLGELTAFIMYLFYLISPLVMLFMAVASLQQGRAAVSRVTELAGIEQEAGAEAVAAASTSSTAAVEFDGVTFTYPDAAEAALKDVSFRLPANGVTAIVGASGAGKTSLIQLIERFHDPDEGTVRVAGVDVRDAPLDQLRARIGLVEQEAPLLRGTIRENLTYAAPDAGADRIAETVAAANLAGVIDALPDGLDTELGEAGLGLSGGQRQRLAIARALMSRPSVLLLDEATANLDADAEAALRDTISSIGQRCQVVVITHRPSTAAVADFLMVMQEGRIRACGTPQELAGVDPIYEALMSGRLDQTDRDQEPVPVSAR